MILGHSERRADQGETAVVGLDHLIALPLQDHAQAFHEFTVVVHQKDGLAVGHGVDPFAA